MSDNDALAQIRKQWPGIRITGYNSSSYETTSVYNPPPVYDTESPECNTNAAKNGAHDSDKCRSCGEFAQLSCIGCKGLPAARGNDTVQTRYCSKECQKEHWRTHRKDCKAAQGRRLLYRSASLVKALFYVYAEITFTWAYFRSVERHGPYRVVYLEEERSNIRNTMLVPFSTVTELVSDRKEQEAILSHLSCNEAVAKFGPMLANMIKGMAYPYISGGMIKIPLCSLNLGIKLGVEEVTAKPKNSKIEILLGQKAINGLPAVRKDGMHHTIFRISLTNNEPYAVDLTGAQYGYQEDCLPWHYYVATRVDEIIETRPFGHTKTWLEDATSKQPRPNQVAQRLKTYFLEELRRSLQVWEAQAVSVGTLLGLPQAEYEAKRVSLLETVKTFMNFSREDSLRQGA